MRVDDKRAAEIARRLVEIRRVVNEDVPDLLADRAELLRENRVLTRALELFHSATIPEDGGTCSMECLRFPPYWIDKARAELAAMESGSTNEENNSKE